MSEKNIVLNMEQMRAIARYEETFQAYIKESEEDDINIEFSEKYHMTLDDLYSAIRNIMLKNPKVDDFGEYWYLPLYKSEEYFGLDEACGYEDEDISDEEAGHDIVRGLPLEESDVFRHIWESFDDDWVIFEGDNISDIPHFAEYAHSIERAFANRGKAVTEREFSEDEKLEFISSFQRDERIKQAGETELILCRRFTDELCEKDSETALRIKGYSSYGGDRLYPCDWPVSRDCMIRLYELTDEPQYANTLGYIYYYGRCTGGEPEYEKAFEMFSVSAANGLYEGMYKLADMFRHGYACRKSPNTARNLYGMVYEDSRKGFMAGQDNSFADAAIRMGNVFLRGIGEEVHPESALWYYLQADYAHRRRMEKSDFFGHRSVSAKLGRSLDETKESLPENYFRDVISTEQPRLIYDLAKDNYRVSLSIEAGDDGKAMLYAERIPNRTGKNAAPVLITVPELEWCELSTKVCYEADGIKASFDSIRFDYCEWNYSEDRVEFYFDDEMIGCISCDEYRLYRPKKY